MRVWRIKGLRGTGYNPINLINLLSLESFILHTEVKLAYTANQYHTATISGTSTTHMKPRDVRGDTSRKYYILYNGSKQI